MFDIVKFKTIMQQHLLLQSFETTENAEKYKLNAVFILQGNQQSWRSIVFQWLLQQITKSILRP